MDHRDFLRELQGSQSIQEFADLIGVARSTVSMIYLDERRPGRFFIVRLLKAFPERRKEILDVFLLPDGQENDEAVIETEEAE